MSDQSQSGIGNGPEGGNVDVVEQRVLRYSQQLARKFYSADSKLDRAERHRLEEAFWYQTVIVPFLGIPIIYGSIMVPIWLQRRRILDPKRSYRGTQVVLGFIGVFAGQAFAKATGYNYYNAKFHDDPNVGQAWSVLGRIDPHIGLRYYSLTTANPELAMPDPAQVNWSQQLAFPLNLIFRKPEPGQAPVIRGGRPLPGSPGPPGSDPDGVSQKVSWPSSQDNSGSSSWDRVRDYSKETDSSTEPVSSTFSPSPPASTSQWPTEDDASKDQAKFDALIDDARKRAGLGKWTDHDTAGELPNLEDTPKDDFSESEKKWS